MACGRETRKEGWLQGRANAGKMKRFVFSAKTLFKLTQVSDCLLVFLQVNRFLKRRLTLIYFHESFGSNWIVLKYLIGTN